MICRRAELPRHQLVAADDSGARDRLLRARSQPHRRRARRPAAAGVTETETWCSPTRRSRPTRTPAPGVHDLRVTFEVARQRSRRLTASASPSARRDLRHRRRVRLRQERDASRPDRAAATDRRPHVRSRAYGGTQPARARRAQSAPAPRRRDLDGLPGPDDVPESRSAGQRADRGGPEAAHRRSTEPSGGARRRADAPRRHRAARATPTRVPASVLRRNAPACAARDRARMRPQGVACRRADDGARRDDPGPDPQAAEATARRARHEHRPRQP